MCWFSIFVICFANLYVDAILLFITGLIGMPSLHSFSCALSTGSDGFFLGYVFYLSLVYDQVTLLRSFLYQFLVFVCRVFG